MLRNKDTKNTCMFGVKSQYFGIQMKHFWKVEYVLRSLCKPVHGWMEGIPQGQIHSPFMQAVVTCLLKGVSDIVHQLKNILAQVADLSVIRVSLVFIWFAWLLKQELMRKNVLISSSNTHSCSDTVQTQNDLMYSCILCQWNVCAQIDLFSYCQCSPMKKKLSVLSWRQILHDLATWPGPWAYLT